MCEVDFIEECFGLGTEKAGTIAHQFGANYVILLPLNSPTRVFLLTALRHMVAPTMWPLCLLSGFSLPFFFFNVSTCTYTAMKCIEGVVEKMYI